MIQERDKTSFFKSGTYKSRQDHFKRSLWPCSLVVAAVTSPYDCIILVVMHRFNQPPAVKRTVHFAGVAADWSSS